MCTRELSMVQVFVSNICGCILGVTQKMVLKHVIHTITIVVCIADRGHRHFSRRL
jgi:CO dehydrogenase nickel-insertion accessory protein CooC1